MKLLKRISSTALVCTAIAAIAFLFATYYSWDQAAYELGRIVAAASGGPMPPAQAGTMAIDGKPVSQIAQSWHATWCETGTGDNTQVTVTHAAESGANHVVTFVSASYSAAVAGKLLQLKDDTTVEWNAYVHNQMNVDLSKGINITAGNATSVVLAASGGAGTIGAVTVCGYTDG